MKKIFLLASFLPAFSQAQNTFRIEGRIISDSAIHGYIYMNHYLNGTHGTYQMDSALIENNSYHFEGRMTDGADRAVIHWNRRPMKLDTGMKAYRSMAVWVGAGDDAHVEHTADYHNIKITSSPVQAQLDSLSHEISLKQRPFDKVIDDFVRAHPSSWVSYIALDQEVRHHDISPESAASLYDALTPSLKQYEYVQALGDLVGLYAGRGDVSAKDLTLDDASGKPVSLASYRGKYVLLDFWASWCGPCRAENPNLLKAYNDYSSKNFTILSVSLDKVRDAWLKAVSEDKLPWTQVSDLKAFESPVARSYKVNAIPSNFLIDPSGKIIGTNLRGMDLSRKLEEVIK